MDTTTMTTATVTLLFTDLVGSTRLLDRLGDEAAGRLRRNHFALLRREIAAAGGEEVKSLGDGLMVAFRSAHAALVCAVAMQRAVAAGNRSGHPLQIRVGLHCGEPHREEEDFFGTAVVVARRLCDTAHGGEILASEVVALLAGSEPEFHLRRVGPLSLKGLAEPVPAVAVDWRASRAVRAESRAETAAVVYADLPAPEGPDGRLGGQVWLTLTRRAAHQAGGRHVEGAGDGVLAVFSSVLGAVRFAHSLQGGAAGTDRPRVAVHAGEDADIAPVADEARALCRAARAGEVVASRVVAAFVGTRTVAAATHGRSGPATTVRGGTPRFSSSLMTQGETAMTTFMLEPTATATGQPISIPDTRYEPVTRRHLEAIGAGPGWRCLVAGGHRSVTGWLETGVGETRGTCVSDLDARRRDSYDGAILEVDLPTELLPVGWFDLALVQLGRLHVFDRARTVHNLLAAVCPGGWMLIEDVVALPFELPEGGTAGAQPSATLTDAIRTVAQDRAADLEWARRVPGLLRARGCSEVTTEAYCSVWPGGSVTLAPRGSTGDFATGTPAGSDAGSGIPAELDPFRRLLVNPFRGGLVDPSLAANSYVLFSTWGRR
jgi:class 3 adenylate cyclase